MALSVLATNIKVNADNVSVEQAVQTANQEIAENFIIENYFDISNVNRSVYDNYRTLVYGVPHNNPNEDNKHAEYRYLGTTPNKEPEENYPNSKYPYDANMGDYLDYKNWVNDPWGSAKVTNRYYITKSDFDDHRLEFLPNFLIGFAQQHGPRFKDDPTIPWEKYMHIVVPPTEYSYGVAWLWHISKDDGLWYITVAMAPEYMVKSNRIEPKIQTPVGKIMFEPSGCSWRNTPLNVRVYVEGDTSVTNSDSDPRDYRFTSPLSGESLTRSIWWEFSQKWNIRGISVNGNPLAAPKPKTINNNGSVTVSQEGIAKLNGKLSGWLSGTRSWVSGSPPRGSWVPSDFPSTDTVMPTADYNSNSELYRIDLTKPYNIQYKWDYTQVKKVDDQFEYMCDSKNDITVTIGDNLAGVDEVRYMFSTAKTAPKKADMIKINDLTTAEGIRQTKDYKINIHEGHTNYWELKKGLWYLHMYQKDRAGNETYTVSPPIYINKLGNLRATTVYDYDWKKYFIKENDQPTELVNNGIRTADMPIYANKESKVIKLGYGVDYKIDTMGFDDTNDKIHITVSYFALDDRKTLHPVDIYIPDNKGNYSKLDSKSTYNSTMKDIWLDANFKGPFESDNTQTTYNTWKFNFYVPYSAKIVSNKESYNEIKDNSFKNKLVVVFDIEGVKEDGRILNYTSKENAWSLGDGTIYGSSYPSKNDLIGRGMNRGEMFWYDLRNTALDDIRLNRRW